MTDPRFRGQRGIARRRRPARRRVPPTHPPRAQVVEKRQAWYAIKFPDGSETAVRKMYLTETTPEAEA